MEKRLHPRTELQKRSVFEVDTLKGITETVDARIINLSARGACISTSRTVQPGKVIRLKLELKDAEVHLPCIAEVRWANPVNNECQLGLQFLS